MNETQHPSRVPVTETTRRATGTAQWCLERGEDQHTPVLHRNNLSVYICGQDAFEKIAQDIGSARHSIDIICWGFDPAMELVRTLPGNGPCAWPRGTTWGELLKAAGSRGVQVRLLAWYHPVGSALANNLPGYRRDAPYELKAAPLRGIAAAVSPGGRLAALPDPTEARDRRETFNARWYRDVAAGAMQGVSLRTRGGVHEDVLASLQKEAQTQGLGGLERFGMEYLATHHQKTIVIDYEGSRPCGYVMGLNSVTDYWDTVAHRFDEPLRGEGWEGAKDHGPGLKPYQDYACRIEGEALVAVCKNFTDAWNKAQANNKGAGSNIQRSFDLRAAPKNLTRNLVYPYHRAQILRTLPAQESSEKSIHRFYSQAGSFARHYIYLENQYFQHAGWVKELKSQRARLLKGGQAAGVGRELLPTLHLMVVTPSPERKGMVPRTHDTLTELGHGESMPNQTAKLEEEIRRYEAVQKAREKDPLLIPPPEPLSELAQNYKNAGGGTEGELARSEIERDCGMRSVVASLWTCDPEWSESKFPVFEKAAREQAAYKRAMEAYRRSQSEGSAANSMPPTEPPSRQKDIEKAQALRYREIYIHSKLMIIDDSVLTLGSANLNVRSFAVDSEINIASDEPSVAKDLRQRVWGQHTMEKFPGGDATNRKVMEGTFKSWDKEAKDNLSRRKRGEALSSFLVAFYDERTSSFRLG